MTYQYRCSLCKEEMESDEAADEMEFPHMSYVSDPYHPAAWCVGRLRRMWTTGLLRENLRNH